MQRERDERITGLANAIVNSAVARSPNDLVTAACAAVVVAGEFAKAFSDDVDRSRLAYFMLQAARDLDPFLLERDVAALN